MTRFLFLTSCMFLCVVFLSPAMAGEKTEVSPLQGIYACTEIRDDAKRLACYDAAAGRLRKAETSGEIVAVHSKELRSIRKEAFGFNLPSLPKLHLPFISKTGSATKADLTEGHIIKQKKSGEISNVEYAVDHIAVKGYGTHWFYLKNGQVWVQTDSKRVTYPKHSKDLKVQIRKASMGSYLLRINGKGRAIRVRRRE